MGYYSDYRGVMSISPKIDEKTAADVNEQTRCYKIIDTRSVIVINCEIKYSYLGDEKEGLDELVMILGILSSKGFVCNGQIEIDGEDDDDKWEMKVVNNKVFERRIHISDSSDNDKKKLNPIKVTYPLFCPTPIFMKSIYFEIPNGLIGMKRDVVLKLIGVENNDESIRNIIGISSECLVWKRHRLFYLARKRNVGIMCNPFGGFNVTAGCGSSSHSLPMYDSTDYASMDGNEREENHKRLSVWFDKDFRQIPACMTASAVEELDYGGRTVFLEKPLSSGIFEMLVTVGVGTDFVHHRGLCSIGAACSEDVPFCMAGELLGHCGFGHRSVGYVGNQLAEGERGTQIAGIWVDGTQRIPRKEGKWTAVENRCSLFSYIHLFSMEVNMHARTIHFFVKGELMPCRIVSVPSTIHVGFSTKGRNSLHIYTFRRLSSPRAGPCDVGVEGDVVWDMEAMRTWRKK